MNRAKSIAAAMAALVLLGGCSSDSVPQGAKSSGPASTRSAGARPSARASKSSRSTRDVPATPKKTEEPRATQSNDDDDYAETPMFDMAVRAIPTCASVGEKMRIEIITKPKAYLTISVFYADYRTHDTHGVGDADSEGKFIHAFQIPIDVPPGDAHVSVVGGLKTKKGEYASAAKTFFTVGPPGGCG